MTSVPARDARTSKSAIADQEGIREEKPSFPSSGDGGICVWFGSVLLAPITAFMLYLCWQMLLPFVSALTWSVALAIAGQPLRRRLIGRMPSTLAALLTMAVILLAIYAAVYGRLVIGVLQGFLGGLIFWFVGLPAPVFWGCLMALLSILPAAGAFIVWAPAAVLLLVTGAWGQALAVLLWGVLVIHPVDNILYPILVGERLGLHALVLFVAFVGGLITFGPPGLILGPAIIAGALGLIAVWRSDLTHFKSEGAPGQ